MIKIVSINTARGDNLAGIMQLVSYIDVILFQEITMSVEQLQQRLGIGYKVWVSHGEGILGIAIAINSKIEDVDVQAVVPGRLQVCQIGNCKVIHVYAPAGTNLSGERRISSLHIESS